MKKFALTPSALIAWVALAFHGQVALAAPPAAPPGVEPEPQANQCYHRHGAISPLTNPLAIRQLAAQAYIWALAPEFVYRFLNYNTLKTAPVNKLGGSTEVAAWNNAATNAGDASVLYLNAVINLSGKQTEGGATDLVLTVPPSEDPSKDPSLDSSGEQYIVVDFLDGFINTVGSIGTRTTPSPESQTYLIAGPQSVYQHEQKVTIRGKEFRVLPTDTNLNWMLIRIRADTLAPSSDPNVFPANSTASVYKDVVQKFALNTLDEYLRNGNQPIFQSSFEYTFTKEQRKRAQRWHSQPCSNRDTCTAADAVDFFLQAGCSLVISPMPPQDFGLAGTPLGLLPPWVAPQAGATGDTTPYANPSYGQQATLDQFGSLGLTANGYAVPRNWGTVQLNALKDGLLDGMAILNVQLTSSPGSSTNFWKYVNADVGTYPNTESGYETRGAIVLAGGSANLAADAVYAQTNAIGTSTIQLNGNNTYKLTFAELPPLVMDAGGNDRGFWSLHVYQPDSSESAAPFLMQTASLNTFYSSANLDVISVDPTANSITAINTTWAVMKASSPVFFSGSAAESYGLIAGKPYYIVSDPTPGTSDGNPTITFQIATVWKQMLSGNLVPIQDSGGPDPTTVVDLLAGNGSFQWGPIQSVSQLGSQQKTSNLLKQNADGSYTIWVGPPSAPGASPQSWVPAPPPGVLYPQNWIPTPSTAYYNYVYGGTSNVNTDIRLMIRMYYPAPGCPPPSILPPIDKDGNPCVPGNPPPTATYVFPLVETGP
jgi:hypothetical protein